MKPEALVKTVTPRWTFGDQSFAFPLRYARAMMYEMVPERPRHVQLMCLYRLVEALDRHSEDVNPDSITRGELAKLYTAARLFAEHYEATNK
jgi:hypothetical protein